MPFLGELRRRNVFRVAAAYVVVAWLVLQVADVLLNNVEAPDWVFETLLILLIVGFPIILVFAWAFELTPEGLKRERHVDRSKSSTRQTGRKLDFLIIGALAIALGYFVWEARLQDESPALGTGAEPATEAAALQPPERSIAVLPFVNMSADPENEYFSDGITEEILNLLAKLPDLQVSSRTSSFAFKNKEVSIPTVVDALGVRHVLEGSVRRSGERVRITAQLIDAKTDKHLWSETYDSELRDIFAVQDRIAHEIVDALKVRLSPEEEAKLEVPRTASVDAYDYYLRGRAHFRQQSRAGIEEAGDMFERAIEIDPGYAPALAWLANIHASIYRLYDSDPAHLERADELSRRAVELAPNLDQAHMARGQVFNSTSNFEQAKEAFETALRLNPRSADALNYYGTTTFLQGDFERTAEIWERALTIESDREDILALLPQVYRSLGRLDDELDAARRGRDLLRQRLLADPGDPALMINLAKAEALSGDEDEAVAIVDDVMAIAEGDALMLYNAGCTYSVAGAKDKAMQALEKSYAAGMADPEWMEQDSDLDPLRDDPRFKDLMGRMRRGQP